MIAAESSGLVTIVVSVIGGVSLIIVALIGVMFKVNAVRNTKQDNDHFDNHEILLTLQTAVLDLQRDMRQQKSDLVEIVNSSRERDAAQAQAACDLVIAAQQLKSELVESARVLKDEGLTAAKTVADALIKAADDYAAQYAPGKVTKLSTTPRRKSS